MSVASASSVSADRADLDPTVLFELPSEFDQRRVFTHGRVAGQQASVTAITSGLTPEAAVRRVADLWRAIPGAWVIEHRQGEWLMASRLMSNQLEIVQFRSALATADGFLTVWRVVSGAAPSPVLALVPQGLRHGGSIDFSEGTRRISSLTVDSDAPAQRTQGLITRHLRSLGFSDVVRSFPESLQTHDGPSLWRFEARNRDLTILARDHERGSRFIFTLSEVRP
jgi:hypothetical protein